MNQDRLRKSPNIAIVGSTSLLGKELRQMLDDRGLPVGRLALLETEEYAGLLQEFAGRSEEHTSELQSRPHLVCRLLLEKKKKKHKYIRRCDLKTNGEKTGYLELTLVGVVWSTRFNFTNEKASTDMLTALLLCTGRRVQ